jgi:hypothetical protein
LEIKIKVQFWPMILKGSYGFFKTLIKIVNRAGKNEKKC